MSTLVIYFAALTIDSRPHYCALHREMKPFSLENK